MTETTVQTWVGRSDEVAVPMLGGEYWVEGKQVEGVFESVREQKIGGFAYRLTLDVAVLVDGEQAEVVEIPSLTGIKNAIQSLREKGYSFRRGDLWRVQCVGIKKAKKEGFSDSPAFEIGVIRK